MSTVNCTYNGFYTFNNGWTWWGTPTSYGYNAMGIDGAGRYRYFVMKATTSSFRSGAGQSITFYFPWCTTNSGYVGTRTIVYSLNTTAPPSSGGGGASADSKWNAARGTELAYGSSSWWLSVASNSSSTGGYSRGGITISSSSLQPNTTYYLWMYCALSCQIYVGNNSTVGTMQVTNTYTDVAYYKPSLSKSSINGYYSSVNWSVGAGSSYPYVYMGWSSTGTFWKKTNNGSACTISTDADTSSTSTKTLYVFRVNLDLGSSASSPGSSYLASASVTRFGARIYNYTTSYSQYNWNSGMPISGFSGWNFKGFTTSSTSTSASWTDAGTGINGKTVYAIYNKPQTASAATKYWYRGHSNQHSLTKTTGYREAWRYGAQKSSGGAAYTTYSSTPTTTCESNSGYSLVGWSSSASSTSTFTTDIYTAWNSYSTVYGVYSYNRATSTNNYTYYRGTSTGQSLTRTITYATAYYYGKGSSSGGGGTTTWNPSSPETSCLANSSYSLVGWTSSASSTTSSYSDIKTAVVDGAVYGIYKLNSSSSTATKYWYRGSSTKNEVTQTKTIAAQYYYGKGTHSGGGISYSYSSTPAITCASNSNYTLQGWTTSSSSTSTSYAASLAGLQSAWQAGYTTLYGVYARWETMTYKSTKSGLSGTVSLYNYYYGAGSKTNNIPKEPSLTYNNYRFMGWSASSTSTIPYTWASLWNSGYRTVYAVWYPIVYYGLSGAWKECLVYVGVNGAWKPVTNLKYGDSGSWKSS